MFFTEYGKAFLFLIWTVLVYFGIKKRFMKYNYMNIALMGYFFIQLFINPFEFYASKFFCMVYLLFEILSLILFLVYIFNMQKQKQRTSKKKIFLILISLVPYFIYLFINRKMAFPGLLIESLLYIVVFPCFICFLLYDFLYNDMSSLESKKSLIFGFIILSLLFSFVENDNILKLNHRGLIFLVLFVINNGLFIYKYFYKEEKYLWIVFFIKSFANLGIVLFYK